MVRTVRGPALTIVGRQGSGKGTQAARLAERLGLAHLSTGELLRAAVAADTMLGRRVAADLDAGLLVPDDVMREVVEAGLNPDVRRRGFLLDGYPRTPEQAADLSALLGDDGLDAAILLDIPPDVARRRLEARRVCLRCGASVVAEHGEEEVPCPVCGGVAVRRPDDTPEAIDQRLAAYDAEARPLLEVLGRTSKLVVVDGVGDPDEVFGRLLAALRPVLWGSGQAVS